MLIKFNKYKPTTSEVLAPSLKRVQRLSHLMTSGALPSSSFLAFDKITDTTPIDIKVREEAASGALSFMVNGEWIDPLTAHNQGRLKSHIRINEKYLNNTPIKAKLADKSKPILLQRKNFNLEPSGIEKIDVPLGTEQSNIIACFIKGDKTNDQAGAGWTVYRENILVKEESLRLGRRNTVLQVYALPFVITDLVPVVLGRFFVYPKTVVKSYNLRNKKNKKKNLYTLHIYPI